MTLAAIHRSGLSDVVHRYAAGVDDREFDAVAVLFTVTAELIVADPPAALRPTHSHRGRAAIGAALAKVGQVARTEHAIIGEVYDEGARPDTARGRITCVAHHWNRHVDQIFDAVWHLRYDDEYEMTAAGWRIARRAMTVNALETRPVRKLLPHDPA